VKGVKALGVRLTTKETNGARFIKTGSAPDDEGLSET